MLSFATNRVSLVIVLIALAACGRTGFLGSSSSDCPPELQRPDGTCGVADGGSHGDGFHRDGGVDLSGDGGPSSCSTCANVGCDQPGCCGCVACSGALFCQTDAGIPDGGDAGDMTDPCATQADCSSPVCVGDPRCHVPGTEICNNGIDDDDNGLIDCADPACSTFPGCQVQTCPNPVDCTLPACVNQAACQDLRCHPSVDFGTLQATGSSVTKSVNTTGTKDVVVTPCAPGGGGMVVGEFTLAGAADVTLAFTQAQGEDHVFGLFRAGVDQPCGANPVACYDPKSATTGQHTYPNLDAGNYYIIAQAFEPAGQGVVSVTLSTPTVPEICNNGIDDNGNGLIDCQEASCANAPNCVNQECDVDINLGALVVNGSGKSTSFTTSGATPNNDLTCEGTPGGGDIVVRFTLQVPAGIQVVWDQQGDHVLGLVRLPDPGQPCNANQLSCYDPSGRQMDDVAFGEQPAGDYAIIFKALKPGDEGHIDATISAYLNRPQELCHNGIDDDGNGLIDCADPACIGVAGCSAPYCQPNVSLGTLNVGDSVSTHLNIASAGQTGYTASCARGGGKGEVIQLTVGGTSGVAIGFNCNETGDHVIDLFQAGGPRDKCDNTELVCADPKTLPFGCNYAVPNLEPGTYNVIVEGYQQGSEGTMDLTISVQDDRVLEICNNGIDDDGNGLTDCDDPKCATSPDCAKVACRPDATVNPVPLDGSNASELVKTNKNGVQAKLPCATAQGGQTAVIAITLTAAADLTLQYNQLGNHDFAIFTDNGTSLPCDAGSVLACQQSNGSITQATSGSVLFSNIPSGTSYLVIAGDQPDTTTTTYSGSVAIELSGHPH